MSHTGDRPAKGIYIAATGQHGGKTTVSLGLISALARRGISASYMKPVGQRTMDVDGATVDPDAALMERIYGSIGDIALASPVTVPSGMTRRFIEGRTTTQELQDRILAGFRHMGRHCDVVVLEGTGHAGVGSVLKLSNARVASLVGASAIIITGGGIGQPIDEFCLNNALFDVERVPVLGVIANKVLPDKLSSVRPLLERGLAVHGTKLLGTMPLWRQLTELSLAEVIARTGARLVSGEQPGAVHIRDVVIAGASPRRMLEGVYERVLVIMPGSREDLALAVLASWAPECASGRLAGVCFTDGELPHEAILSGLRRVGVPVIATHASTYDVAATVARMTAKTTAQDEAKIELTKQLVERYVDVDRLAELLGLEGRPSPAPFGAVGPAGGPGPQPPQEP